LAVLITLYGWAFVACPAHPIVMSTAMMAAQTQILRMSFLLNKTSS
jgi:hypothetical protein